MNNPHRTNVLMERELHKLATRKAFELEFPGGFSEYVARLVIADMKREKSLSLENGRYIFNAATKKEKKTRKGRKSAGVQS